MDISTKILRGALINAQNLDGKIRSVAEGKLKQLQDENLPNFLLSLSAELSSDESPLDCRRLAGIILENSVEGKYSEDNMCLDYAGKDEKSGAILFYVVQGGYSPPKHDVDITIVQVKTKRTPSNKRKPVGVDCVDRVKRFILHGETLDARCCFAVSCV